MTGFSEAIDNLGGVSGNFPLQSEALLDEASAGQKRITRKEEISKIIDSQSKVSLSLNDRREIGTWLRSHQSRLKNADPADGDVITKSDIIASYSSARWSDKSKFLWADMRMLKRVAGHFDEIALGGRSAASIEPDDIETMIKGGIVKRTQRDITTTFPDGSLTRRTSGGDLFKKGTDGSLSYEAATVRLELAANGSGYLRFKTPDFFGQKMEDHEIKLSRGKDGLWIGKNDDGEDVELAIDDHSVRLRSPSMDMLFTSTGGFYRDPTDVDSAMYINPDGSVTMSENGKIYSVAVNPDNGIILGKGQDGSIVVQYPNRYGGYKRDVDGNINFRLADLTVSAPKAGEMTARIGETPAITGSTLDDGTRNVTLPAGLTITFDKSGNLNFITPPEHGGKVFLIVDATGGLTLMADDGSKRELRPPAIRF